MDTKKICPGACDGGVQLCRAVHHRRSGGGSPRLSQGIANRLFYKKLYCDYENLEDKALSGQFEEAERCLWYGQPRGTSAK